MEAPIHIQAPYQPHLLRGHSYPNELYSARKRDSREFAMSGSRYPSTEERRNESFPPNGSNKRSAPSSPDFDRRQSDRGGSDHERLPLSMRPQRFLPQVVASTQSRMSSVPVSQLVNESADSPYARSYSHPHSSPYSSHPASAPRSPPRQMDPDAQRLPSVETVSR